MDKRFFAAALAATLLAGTASAATITFDDLPGTVGDTFSSYSESGYTVTLLSGAAYVATLGNPGPAIFFRGESVGDSAGIELELTFGGGTFSFGSFDLARIGPSATVSYSATGYLGAATIFNASGTQTAVGFGTKPGADGVIDRLRFTLSTTGTSANIDNIVVNAANAAVPEPASWAMMITGFGAVGGVMRRRPVRPAVCV